MEVQTLEKLITKYSQSYYSGESEVSDDYFDSLIDELKEKCPESPVLNSTGWGYQPKKSKKVFHRHGLFIGSLPKVKDIGDLPPFAKYNPESIRISAKLDGLSVVSYYEHGKRVLAVTRGNGNEGIDVTSKINIISPETVILPTPFTGAVRGEVVMPQSVWDSEYVDLIKENESANPRNFAAGVLGRDEDTVKDLKNLVYCCYKVIYSENIQFTKLSEIDDFLDMNGFDHVDSLYNVEFTQEKFEKIYNSFLIEYPCDGLVLTKLSPIPSDIPEYKEIAYKFKADSEEVIVTDVTFEATRTGRMAPRIWFDPIKLSGAMVQKCTGFNAKFILDNHIGVGSVIEVCRSNEVIPHIVRVLQPASTTNLPEVCPHCGNLLKWNGVDLFCDKELDSSLSYNFLSTMCPLDGAGYSLYSSIVEILGLNSREDLKCLLEVINSGDISLILEELHDNISGEVTRSKACRIIEGLTNQVHDYAKFLVACNIKGISWATAEALMDEYPTYFKDLFDQKVDYDRIYRITGFGERTVETLKTSEKLIKDLAAYIKFKPIIPKKKIESKFKVAITGALSVKRADFDAKLLEYGIEQSGNFNEIKYLITNNPESTSSKMKKAKEKGIEVISEEEFITKYFI